MNKRLLIFIIITGLLLLGIVLMVVYVITSSSHNPQPTQSTTTFPVSGATQASSSQSNASSGITTIQDSSNQPMLVKDFIHSPQTVQDPHDSGTYVLAGNSDFCLEGDNCPPGASSSTEYEISYEAQYNLFTILLLAEPLGKARDDAQTFLTNALGISASQLCSLKYTVGTIISISDVYGGEELGLDGCPDAVALPQ